ncbi:hypothetical protein D3C73_638630 [compost metagenome]
MLTLQFNRSSVFHRQEFLQHAASASKKGLVCGQMDIVNGSFTDHRQGHGSRIKVRIQCFKIDIHDIFDIDSYLDDFDRFIRIPHVIRG